MEAKYMLGIASHSSLVPAMYKSYMRTKGITWHRAHCNRHCPSWMNYQRLKRAFSQNSCGLLQCSNKCQLWNLYGVTTTFPSCAKRLRISLEMQANSQLKVHQYWHLVKHITYIWCFSTAGIQAKTTLLGCPIQWKRLLTSLHDFRYYCREKKTVAIDTHLNIIMNVAGSYT